MTIIQILVKRKGQIIKLTGNFVRRSCVQAQWVINPFSNRLVSHRGFTDPAFLIDGGDYVCQSFPHLNRKMSFICGTD